MQINPCHAEQDETARLACYDLRTGFTAVSDDGDDTPEVAGGLQWLATEKTSGLDDRTDIWLSVNSNASQPNQIGRPERATLWVRCMGNKTNLFITFNDFTTDNQNVRYKIDDNPVRKVWMVHMQGGKGIGIWSGGAAIPFIRKLLDAETMVVAYKSYSNLNLEFDFDISGLRARIDPLAASCQWSL